MGSHTHSPSIEHQSSDGGIRKRVCKACDRCRLKKSKCDGSSPCGRCRTDNAICVFGERKKSHDKVYPKGYVEMLEQQQAQLVAALQELYKRAINGQGWQGALLTESTNGNPLTHDILERLGTLKQEGHGSGDMFEEDLSVIQQRLIASGSGFMQRAESPEGSDDLHSPILDTASTRQPSFIDPFPPRTHLPPTPPEDGPLPGLLAPGSAPSLSSLNPANVSTFAEPTTRSVSLNPAVLQQQCWSPSTADFDESLAFNNFDPLGAFETSMPSQYAMNGMPMYPMAVGNISLRDWNEEDAFKSYFNPTLA